jgi:hypothetical protein
MKLQGYDSARAFTQRIDEMIADQGSVTDSLPHSNSEEVASSAIRSANTRQMMQPGVLDRVRRQR